ncbi:AbrB family transcriptional regulator [Nocardioides sp.]|uniref:AbrB family transcriptional regulator n=1 Tax=Nocardioides sp. TaxID=35761 RepID=UPI0039E2587C
MIALVAGLLLGMAISLLTSAVPPVPEQVFRLAQAMIGVVIGADISLDSVARMGKDAPTIVLITLATIGISLAAGRLLALRRDVSRVTGAFALIAGGASGVTVVARDLGADDRVVVVVQYLRVLVVLLTLPLVTTLVFHPATGQGALIASQARLGPSLGYVAVALALGLLATRLLPFTASVVLVPMVVGAALAATGWFGTVAVPAPIQWVAMGLIGLQVGLRFTRASLASIARMLPTVLALILGMIAATAAVGSLLAVLTPIDGLTAYLATTPGGLPAVLATAADSGSDVTYVMAVQLVRLLVIMFLLPFLARWLRR